MQQMEIWLVILKKFQAKQIFVLSSSIKLGPEPFMWIVVSVPT